MAPKNVGIITPASNKLNTIVISVQLDELVLKNDFLRKQLNCLNVADKITIGGYTFKKDQSVCVGINFNDELVAIRIKHILFENNSINPIFVGPKEIYKYAHHLNCYIFDSLGNHFNHIFFNEIKTEKCLIKYKDLLSDKLFAIIHHF